MGHKKKNSKKHSKQSDKENTKATKKAKNKKALKANNKAKKEIKSPGKKSELKRVIEDNAGLLTAIAGLAVGQATKTAIDHVSPFSSKGSSKESGLESSPGPIKQVVSTIKEAAEATSSPLSDAVKAIADVVDAALPNSSPPRDATAITDVGIATIEKDKAQEKHKTHQAPISNSSFIPEMLPLDFEANSGSTQSATTTLVEPTESKPEPRQDHHESMTKKQTHGGAASVVANVMSRAVQPIIGNAVDLAKDTGVQAKDSLENLGAGAMETAEKVVKKMKSGKKKKKSKKS